MTSVLATIAPEIERDFGDVVRGTAIAIDSGLINETPVDTGRARGNWIVSLNRANPNRDINPIGQSGAPQGSAQAILQGTQTISAAPAFGKIFIQNNLPYINRLNDGWSDQAPRKFVETVIDRVMATANNLLKKLKR